MAKTVHFSASRDAPKVSADRSASEDSARDTFAAIILFSATGLVVSLIALLLGLPAVWF